MQCNPWRWLWGVIPIAMLTAGAFMTEREGIEQDLTLRAKQNFERMGFDWAEVTFEGRDAILRGRAVEEDEPRRAIDALRKVWGVRISKSRTNLVEKVDAYSWLASLDGKTIRLRGYVPGEDVRRSTLSAIKNAFPKYDIADDMTVARGAPKRDVWVSGIGFGLKQLQGLKKGSVRLDDANLSIEGEALDQPSFKSIRAAVPNQLPKGWKLGTASITPPAVNPFTWLAKSAGNQLVLSGFVPDDATKDQLFQFAKAQFPKAAIVDKLEIAGGAPDQWLITAKAGLAELKRLKDGSAEMRGREILLSGTADDEDIANAVRAQLRSSAAQGYKVTDNIKAIAKAKPQAVSPYTTSLVNDGKSLTVTGYVPSDAARAALFSAIRSQLPGVSVIDRTSVAAGASTGWEPCILSGVAGLKRLQTGSADLTDAKLVVTGLAADAPSALSLAQDFKAAATSSCQPDARIDVAQASPSSFWWSAERNGKGSIELTGEAPDEAGRAAIVKLAEQLFQGERITDTMTVVSRSSSTWFGATSAALKTLSSLNRGTASVFGDDVSVRGIATSQEYARNVRTQLQTGLPSGFRYRDDIRVFDEAADRTARDAADAAERERQAEVARSQAEAEKKRQRQAYARDCQLQLMETAAKSGIRFERASADLTRTSTPTLKKLAKIANGCPGTRIEIAGHTDSEGIPERNNPLSERRAAAVRDFLVKAGVESDRLTSRGYGADQPIGNNDTPEGRALNRRIEFNVVPN